MARHAMRHRARRPATRAAGGSAAGSTRCRCRAFPGPWPGTSARAASCSSTVPGDVHGDAAGDGNPPFCVRMPALMGGRLTAPARRRGRWPSLASRPGLGGGAGAALSNTLGVQANPIGLEDHLTLQWTWGLSDSPNPFLADAHFAAGVSNHFSPAYDRLELWVELSPLSVLDLRAGVEPLVYFGTFGHIVAFPSYDVPTSARRRWKRSRTRPSPPPASAITSRPPSRSSSGGSSRARRRPSSGGASMRPAPSSTSRSATRCSTRTGTRSWRCPASSSTTFPGSGGKKILAGAYHELLDVYDAPQNRRQRLGPLVLVDARGEALRRPRAHGHRHRLHLRRGPEPGRPDRRVPRPLVRLRFLKSMRPVSCTAQALTGRRAPRHTAVPRGAQRAVPPTRHTGTNHQGRTAGGGARMPTSKPSEAPLVLVVDDNEDNRDVAVQALLHSGFRVDTAVDGAEGLRKAAELHPAAIVMDLSMPNMDGWKATAAIKAVAGARGHLRHRRHRARAGRGPRPRARGRLRPLPGEAGRPDGPRVRGRSRHPEARPPPLPAPEPGRPG